MPGSSIPLSDAFRPDEGRALPPRAREWFADPRLLWWQGRLYLYWNSGGHMSMNYQFIQELEASSLQPVGLPCSLECADGRNPIEKNWSLFACEDALYAFYTLSPAVVLRLIRRTSSAFVFSKIATIPWDATRYSSRFGSPRGGAPPLLYRNKLYIFFHSIWCPLVRRRYSVALLITAAKPPFEPLFWSPKPVSLPNPFGSSYRYPPLHPGISASVYPTGGVVLDDQTLLVSYGINNEHAAIARLDPVKLANNLIPACLGNHAADHIGAFLFGLPGKIVRRLIHYFAALKGTNIGKMSTGAVP